MAKNNTSLKDMTAAHNRRLSTSRSLKKKSYFLQIIIYILTNIIPVCFRMKYFLIHLEFGT